MIGTFHFFSLDIICGVFKLIRRKKIRIFVIRNLAFSPSNICTIDWQKGVYDFYSLINSREKPPAHPGVDSENSERGGGEGANFFCGR